MTSSFLWFPLLRRSINCNYILSHYREPQVFSPKSLEFHADHALAREYVCLFVERGVHTLQLIIWSVLRHYGRYKNSKNSKVFRHTAWRQFRIRHGMMNRRRRRQPALLRSVALIIALISILNMWISLSQSGGIDGKNISNGGSTLQHVLSQSAASVSLMVYSGDDSSYKMDKVEPRIPKSALDRLQREKVHLSLIEEYSRKGQMANTLPSTVDTIEKNSSKMMDSRTGMWLPHASTRNETEDKALIDLTLFKLEKWNPALPPVQALPDQGDVRPARSIPETDRKLFQTVEDLKPIQDILSHVSNFDNSTINPMLPSLKVQYNPITIWNVEIPVNYSMEAPMTSTVPWSNCTTLAFYEGRLRSGFRNQIMAFVILILEANRVDASKGKRQPHCQFLLRSLGQKDTYGTNSFIPFAKLWDVPHWNSHFPQLPRLVDYDPILHSQFNYDNTRWYRTPSFNATDGRSVTLLQAPLPIAKWFGTYGLFASHKPRRPCAFGYQHKLMTAYSRYAKGKGGFAADASASGSSRNPAEILMLKGAMRPHPSLQAIIDNLLRQTYLLSPDESTAVSSSLMAKPLQLDYMTLHARVEPDMQNHQVCREKKVLNLTDIFEFIERMWPEPPVSKIFMPINRQYLELEGDIDGSSNSSAKMTLPVNDKKKKRLGGGGVNWVAVENLRALNWARDVGLWHGRAKVIEFGANALDGTSYADQPSTAGAMLNFFIGVPAKIFVGTEVSSFSHDLLATRFFRGYSENYKYLPSGLHDWTPAGTVDPAGFGC